MLDAKGNAVTKIWFNPNGTITINDLKGNLTNMTKDEFTRYMADLTEFLAQNMMKLLDK